MNLDAIDRGRAATHFGADVREILTDLQSRDASLGLIDISLFERRTAEESIDVLSLQYIREHVIHIHDGEDLLHEDLLHQAITRGIGMTACPHSHSIVPGGLEVMS